MGWIIILFLLLISGRGFHHPLPEQPICWIPEGCDYDPGPDMEGN